MALPVCSSVHLHALTGFLCLTYLLSETDTCPLIIIFWKTQEFLIFNVVLHIMSYYCKINTLCLGQFEWGCGQVLSLHKHLFVAHAWVPWQQVDGRSGGSGEQLTGNSTSDPWAEEAPETDLSVISASAIIWTGAFPFYISLAAVVPLKTTSVLRSHDLEKKKKSCFYQLFSSFIPPGSHNCRQDVFKQHCESRH